MPAYGHEKNNLHCTLILVAQHHATVVHTHRQSRIFFLKDTNQINEVSPSLQMGTFDKVSTRYCLRTAQMHKVGTPGKLPCQFTGIILFTRTQ